MARKQLKKAGDTEKKTRWNKKRTRKYELEYKLVEVQEKPKKLKRKLQDEKALLRELRKTVAAKSTKRKSTKVPKK